LSVVDAAVLQGGAASVIHQLHQLHQPNPFLSIK